MLQIDRSLVTVTPDEFLDVMEEFKDEIQIAYFSNWDNNLLRFRRGPKITTEWSLVTGEVVTRLEEYGEKFTCFANPDLLKARQRRDQADDLDRSRCANDNVRALVAETPVSKIIPMPGARRLPPKTEFEQACSDRRSLTPEQQEQRAYFNAVIERREFHEHWDTRGAVRVMIGLAEGGACQSIVEAAREYLRSVEKLIPPRKK